MIELLPEKQMNKKISHLPGVRSSVQAEGRIISEIATARLAAHRRTGQARIDFSMGATDAHISLVDPAALSIEFGHYLGRQELGTRRHFVRGLHLFLEWYHEGIV